MKIRTFVFLLLPLFLFSAEEKIEVMSFNIRYGTAKDGENHWDKRKDFVVDTIRDSSPDILGTQENLSFQAEFLAGKLPEYERYGKGRDQFGRGERCELYWKTNRFEKISTGSFMLSETPDKHGSKSWDAALPRIASWVILKHRRDSSPADNSSTNHLAEIFVVNTHFDHRGAKAREQSAKLLRERATVLAGERPIVMMGDLNFGPRSAGYNVLVQEPWRDTYRSAHPKEEKGEGTFSAFRGVRDRQRIDYIFVRGLKVEAATIDRRERDGRNPSDHFPVTATLKTPATSDPIGGHKQLDD